MTTIGLTKAEAETLNGAAITNTGSMTDTQNRGNARFGTAGPNQFITSISIMADNGSATDDRNVLVSVYDKTSGGDQVPLAFHLFEIPLGTPLDEITHIVDPPIAVTNGVDYGVVAVGVDGGDGFYPALGSEPNASGAPPNGTDPTGVLKSRQLASASEVILDPFDFDSASEVAQDYIMSAQLTTIAPEGAPTLTTPYTTIVLDRGDSGSIDLSTNWTGASTFAISGLPLWMAQSGSTGTVDYTNVQWGGKNSDNTIGHGVWDIQVQAIDSSGLLTTETAIWLYIRP